MVGGGHVDRPGGEVDAHLEPSPVHDQPRVVVGDLDREVREELPRRLGQLLGVGAGAVGDGKPADAGLGQREGDGAGGASGAEHQHVHALRFDAVVAMYQ